MTQFKRRTKNILLEPLTQLRYTYYLLILAITPMLVLMGFTVIELIKVRSTLQLIEHLPPELPALFDRVFSHVSFGFGIALLLTGVAVIYGVLAVSHRFVGPAYVINGYISSLLKNEPPNGRELRKEDELKKTWDLLRELGERYRQLDSQATKK